MPLSLRKRGDVWHARGTVRVGRDSIAVKEFSTGCSSRPDAEAVAGAEEARIRAEHLEGDAGRAKRLTFAACALHYLRRPGGVQPYDKDRIGVMAEAFGDTALADLPRVWSAWVGSREWQPGTAARWRAVAQAAVSHGCEAEGVPAAKLPGVRQPVEDRVVSLVPAEREALIRAYNPHAACPALLLAYAGLRTQEALRLDWREVDLNRARLWIGRTKTGRGRMVPMHRRVSLLLWGMWEAAGRPARGPVFLSSKGKPYEDTRGKGGNPLAQAHATACRIAGVRDFRPHDWRHDFATRFLAEGGDVRGLMQVMGWRQARMVERYVTHKDEHLADILRRVA